MKSSTMGALVLVFESLACVWVLNQHLPGLLFAPLPMPLWQQIARLSALIAGLLPLAMLAVRPGTVSALSRSFTILAGGMGLGLWVALIGVHPLEIPPFNLARLWVCVALMVPLFVLPAMLGGWHARLLASMSALPPDTPPCRASQPRRGLYAWWLLLGTYALCELIVGEVVRTKEWRVMIVEKGPYALITGDARHFYIAPAARWQHRYSSDPDGYFGSDREIVYRTNSRGLRERERPIKKPASVFRIIALGDSFTLGEGVHVQDTWPRQLERILREKYGSKSIEVINAGVNAYNTRQELEHYRRNVRDYEPDFVIVAMVWNDARPGDAKTFGASFAATTSALAQYLPLTDRIGRTIASLLGHTGVPTSDEDWRDSFQALMELKKDTAASNAGFLVAIYPSVRHLDNESLQRVYRLQEDFCAKMRLPLFDAWTVFKDLPPRQWHVHPADNHPNAAAHEEFAKHLADRIAPILDRRQIRRSGP